MMGYGYTMYHAGHLGGFGLGLGWFFGLIFWVLIIWLVISFLRGASYHHCQDCGRHGDMHRGSFMPKGDGFKNSSGGNAMNILKERYAKGEISKDDFDKMKVDLQ